MLTSLSAPAPLPCPPPQPPHSPLPSFFSCPPTNELSQIRQMIASLVCAAPCKLVASYPPRSPPPLPTPTHTHTYPTPSHCRVFHLSLSLSLLSLGFILVCASACHIKGEPGVTEPQAWNINAANCVAVWEINPLKIAPYSSWTHQKSRIHIVARMGPLCALCGDAVLLCLCVQLCWSTSAWQCHHLMNMWINSGIRWNGFAKIIWWLRAPGMMKCNVRNDFTGYSTKKTKMYIYSFRFIKYWWIFLCVVLIFFFIVHSKHRLHLGNK